LQAKEGESQKEIHLKYAPCSTAYQNKSNETHISASINGIN